jgi:hypothetical protein
LALDNAPLTVIVKLPFPELPTTTSPALLHTALAPLTVPEPFEPATTPRYADPELVSVVPPKTSRLPPLPLVVET